MARELIAQITDDLDGAVLTDGGETVLFSLDGRAYEIDLSPENAARLRGELQRYVEAGRRVSAGPRGGKAQPAAARRQRDLGDVREWARRNGHKVNDRGRISASVLEAYESSRG